MNHVLSICRVYIVVTKHMAVMLTWHTLQNWVRQFSPDGFVRQMDFDIYISSNGIIHHNLSYWSERSACAALGCCPKRRWPL
jgi:hypothetical protein